MRNPPITMQRSIFEPLHSQEIEVYRQPKHLQAAVNLSPSSSSSSSSEKYFAEPHTSSPNMRRAPFFFHDHAAPAMHGGTHSPFFSKKAKSEHDLTSDLMNVKCSSSTGNGSSDDDDDGSVAIKLLGSITKSTSSPSLLASCKESARETPYQKTMKLRRMKLQHCAEELGSESSESSDSSSCYGGQSIYDKLDISPSSCPPSVTFSEVHQKTEISPSSMITVQSAPSLSGTPMTSNHSSYTRGRSFPPPLSHTLPAASSSESFSFSLRPYRENGRLVLKEVKVPCRQYLQANRKDGRLTLHVFTRDDEYRENFYSEHHQEAASKEYIQAREAQEEEHIDNTIQEAEGVKSNTIHNQEVDSGNTVQSLYEEVHVEESEDIVDVGMDEFEASNAILHNCSFERVKCLADEGLLIATIEGNDDNVDDDKNVISNVVALSLKNSKFTIHKAQMLPSSKVSTNPPLSGSLTQQALMHPPGKSHGLPLSHHDISTLFSQSNENFAWEGNLMQLSAAGKSLKRGYGGGGDASSPTIIFEEMNAKCLMEKVSNLAASFGLQTGYSGKWCLGKMKSSLDGVGGINGGVNGNINGGINGINVGVSVIDGGGNDFIDGVFNDINSGVNLDVSYGHDLRAFEGGTDVAWSLPSPFHFDLQIPSSTIQAALQGTGSEWLHTLHCKDLFDRNQLGKGFMKLHSVATRS